ncbi:hypothetical protein K474DRAFT_1653183 [Panus rudis PR-1116 ss-1]|nr:hypothetical protein K474DRAFT_1653333 [Panus rudis PR-1116 ss-1]KAI0070945.1 hypothetical protein K474DRAFT_1653183 [Panus rudis PR-1116 ss-1]
MSDVLTCIAADPDISGVGVRSAIYIQNLLSFIPAFWALMDGEVSSSELDAIENQSTTILITAFAILVSAIVEAKTLGLSNFHADIVLSLSWMNNTNTFIYFLLYVQHKSQPGEGQVKTTWSSWTEHMVGKLAWMLRKSETSVPGACHFIVVVCAYAHLLCCRWRHRVANH